MNEFYQAETGKCKKNIKKQLNDLRNKTKADIMSWFTIVPFFLDVSWLQVIKA